MNLGLGVLVTLQSADLHPCRRARAKVSHLEMLFSQGMAIIVTDRSKPKVDSKKQNFESKFFCNSKLLCNFATEMRIVSHRRLVEFYSSEGHGDAQTALERWYDIAEKAEWKNLSDIKADFPTTDYVGNQHYVFDIRGNKYRLVVVVKFTIGHIFIRFVGTHSEYDKIDVSTI